MYLPAKRRIKSFCSVSFNIWAFVLQNFIRGLVSLVYSIFQVDISMEIVLYNKIKKKTNAYSRRNQLIWHIVVLQTKFLWGVSSFAFQLKLSICLIIAFTYRNSYSRYKTFKVLERRCNHPAFVLFINIDYQNYIYFSSTEWWNRLFRIRVKMNHEKDFS